MHLSIWASARSVLKNMAGNMTYNLFLDDERIPRDVTWVDIGLGPWVIVRNYDEFCNYIDAFGIPDKVSFDHDLADVHYQACFTGSGDYGPEHTGLHCAKMLVDECHERGVPFPPYTVHSMNPVGRENIQKYIEFAREKGFIQ